jgi:uroporphyrinogen-III synthase
VRVLVLRGEQGRTDWIDNLRRRGATVDARSIYRSERVEPAADQLAVVSAWAREDLPACWVFSATDSVTASGAWLGALGLEAWALRQRALCIHPRIGEALRAAGWSAVELVAPGERALVAALESA